MSCSELICTCCEQDKRHRPRPLLCCLETELSKHTLWPLLAFQHTHNSSLGRREGKKVILVKHYACLTWSSYLDVEIKVKRRKEEWTKKLRVGGKEALPKWRAYLVQERVNKKGKIESNYQTSFGAFHLRSWGREWLYKTGRLHTNCKAN